MVFCLFTESILLDLGLVSRKINSRTWINCFEAASFLPSDFAKLKGFGPRCPPQHIYAVLIDLAILFFSKIFIELFASSFHEAY